MLDRYFITLGAPTTAGGRVTSANHAATIDDVPMALEGDTCWCPVCLSEGVIRPDGPRLSDTFDGRELALADDLCVCKCSPPPRLVAAQTFMCQSVDAARYADDAAAAARSAAESNAAAQDAPDADTLPLALIDPDTQEPLRHRPYRLELADRVIEGTLDQNGRTRPLSAAERAGVVSWQVQPEAT
jgi:uncharacterized Zn-binding protein involved in type VI secretion